MWEPYKDVVHVYLPNALIAVDPFHVIMHLTSNFDRLRIDLMNQCEYGSNSYYLLKKWHWLLTKDNIFFDNKRVYNNRFKTNLNRRVLFNMIMDTFPILSQAEEFTGILFNWHDEILNSFKRPYADRKLSNAFTENVNSRLKKYLAISNGISNFQRFRKR